MHCKGFRVWKCRGVERCTYRLHRVLQSSNAVHSMCFCNTLVHTMRYCNTLVQAALRPCIVCSELHAEEPDTEGGRVTRHTSHVTRHTSHVIRNMSHATRHMSHVTRHTSHVPGKALITNKRSLHHALQVPSPSPKHNRKPLTASQLLTCRNASRGSPPYTSPPHATWRTSPACRVTCDV